MRVGRTSFKTGREAKVLRGPVFPDDLMNTITVWREGTVAECSTQS